MKDNTKKTILLVDDDIDFLMQTESILKKAGFKTVTANSQAEAEETLKQVKPDLALLDLMMENMDGGFALAYHIEKLAGLTAELNKKLDNSIPVIIASAVTSETGIEFDAATDEEKSWIKADLFLAKPVRAEQLIAHVEKLLYKAL